MAYSEDKKSYTSSLGINPLAAGLMAAGDAISGIYGQRGNTYGNYLDALAKRQAAQWEMEKYKQENDPLAQINKTINTYGAFLSSEQMDRLLKQRSDLMSQSGQAVQPGVTAPAGVQPPGVQAPKPAGVQPTIMVPSGNPRQPFKTVANPDYVNPYTQKKDTRSVSNDLRKEFQAIETVKDYQVIKNQVDGMDSLLKKVDVDKQSALALDQGLITLFNKVTDPQSVVRESEYARTPQNLSLANRFNGALDKLSKGGAGLTNKDREALVFGAKIIAESRGSNYNEIVSNYENLAKQNEIDPSMVIGGYGRHKSYFGESTTSKMQTFNVNGQTYRVPADEVAAFKKDMGLK